jgi:hypothetical protein
MSCRKKKSLHFNLESQDPYEGGKNVVYHRDHRSTKGRNKSNVATNYAIYLYKKKKKELFYENDEDLLAL